MRSVYDSGEYFLNQMPEFQWPKFLDLLHIDSDVLISPTPNMDDIGMREQLLAGVSGTN